MDKRFVIFLLLSTAILMGNFGLQAYLHRNDVAPPPEDGKGESVVAAKTGKTEKTAPAKTKQPEEVKPAPKDPVEPKVVPSVPRQVVTLGSADPSGRYRMLVSLDNRGAVVRRLELSNPKYRDLHDKSGYLGHLAIGNVEDVSGGCRVGAVGAGTPAAVAGMQVGDVITQIGGEPVDDRAAFLLQMTDTKPKDTIEVTVRRGAQTLALSATLTRRPLEVIRPEAENYLMRGETPPEQDEQPFEESPSLLLRLFRGAGGGEPPVELASDRLRKEAWEVGALAGDENVWQAGAQSQDRVTFRQQLPEEGLIVYKTFALEPVPEEEIDNPSHRSYHLTVSIRIDNVGSEEAKVAYVLDGPNGLPTEGWWYAYKISPEWFDSAGLRDFVFSLDSDESQFISCTSVVAQIDDDELAPKKDTRVKYAGVDAQYFSSVLMTTGMNTEDIEFGKLEYGVVGDSHEDQKNLSNVSFQLTSDVKTLPPDGSVTDDFELFAGPRMPALMEAYGIDSLIYYGWFWWVAKPMLGLLHMFYAVLGNYGVAIFLLTVLVRGCMYPISRKQALSAQKMQQLAPEIKKLQEKYGKDMEKRMKAQRELWAKHKVNPLAGCLPVFLQLPIFIGLYRSLTVDIELRDASLLGQSIRWCSNLAAPDRLLDWSAWLPEFITQGQGIFILGPYLNILPIITISTWIIQQKMFMPPPTDDQQAMQQKMMKFMMIFMGLMFFKVAAGLCLYFIASSTWSICERKLLPKAKAPPITPEDKTDPLVERREARKTDAQASSNGNAQSRKKKKKKQGRK